MQKFRLFIICGILLVSIFMTQSAFAGFDTIYFSANGDTTATSMTQGDEIGFGSNCELGATMLWEVWMDLNNNSAIDPLTDALIMSEHFTDGLLGSDGTTTPDGSLFLGPFLFGPEPGKVIFRTTDLATDSSLQLVVTVNAMVAPPNQFTGQISLPGVTPPNAQLANRVIISESDSGDEGTYVAVTDNNGNYSINISSDGTGVEFIVEAPDFDGFVSPGITFETVSGVVENIDFVYEVAVDSVYGVVKDDLGLTIPFETEISAQSNVHEKYTTTKNGRYVIYFSESQKGQWSIYHDTPNAPIHLNPGWFQFSHDTLTSFVHDFILISTDAVVYARVTENGALPANNYALHAYSQTLDASGEAVSDVGANNIVAIPVSSNDPTGWRIEIANWEDDYPIPPGLTSMPIENVSIGDTVTLNLVTGLSISGTFTQDVGDDPISWESVWAGSNSSGTNVNPDGTYEYFTTAGMQSLFPFANGYITNPQFRDLNVSGDIAGVDFTINKTHSTVTGQLINVSLPLDASWYTVTAYTGTDGTDGYMVFANVDSVTGTYTLNLCDGDWKIAPPCCFPNVDDALTANITIGEAPADEFKTHDFTYELLSCCIGIRGNINNDPSDQIDIEDLVMLVTYMFSGGATPTCIEEANVNASTGSSPIDIEDLVMLVSYMFSGGSQPVSCP